MLYENAMLLGVKTEIIDADNLRNAVRWLNSKVEKLVVAEAAKVPDNTLGIKGYVTPEKISATFEKSSQGVMATDFVSFAATLGSFLEPYTRQKDTMENINTALTDVLDWCIKENYSEARLAKVMDVCAKKYEHKKSVGLAEEAAATDVSHGILNGLLGVFEMRYQVEGDTPDRRKTAQDNLHDFVGRVRGIIEAEKATAAPRQTVVQANFPRKDAAPIAKAE